MASDIGGPYVTHIFGDAVTELYKQHLGWLSAEVTTSIAWPLEDTAVHYDHDDYFLRGTGRDHSLQPCLTIRTSASQSSEQAIQKLYKFGSMLGWYLRGYVDVGGYATSSHPIRYGRTGADRSGQVMSEWQNFNCNYMPIIASDEARKALAFWREGRRLYRIHDPYSFLSFYKVIDSQFTKAGGRDKAAWIKAAIPRLKNLGRERVAELQLLGVDVATHIYESGRHAVAHASIGEVIVDPDLVEDRNRIHSDIDVMQGLAQLFIAEELKIPDHMQVYRERDRLKPLYAYFGAEMIHRIKNSDAIPRRSLPLNCMKVNVNVWPEAPHEAFKNLTLAVTAVRNAVVRIQATDSRGTLCLTFYLDFKNGEAHAGIEENFALHPKLGGDVESAISNLNFYRDVLGNKTAELELENGEKVQCKVVIPVDIDFGATSQYLELEIANLRTFEAIRKG